MAVEDLLVAVGEGAALALDLLDDNAKYLKVTSLILGFMPCSFSDPFSIQIIQTLPKIVIIFRYLFACYISLHPDLHQVRAGRTPESRVDEARGALPVLVPGRTATTAARLLREARRRRRVVRGRIVHHGAARGGGVPVGGLEEFG